jgi:hypothetical protein
MRKGVAEKGGHYDNDDPLHQQVEWKGCGGSDGDEVPTREEEASTTRATVR